MTDSASGETWGPQVTLWDLVGDDLAMQIDKWRGAMCTDGAALLSNTETVAEEKILLAFLNDGLALVDHVGRLDGRSATLSARALFEHLVNLRDVQESSVNTAGRYEAQRHVLAEQVSRRRWHLPLLERKVRQREDKRLDRLGRSAAAPLAAALGTYPGLGSGWAEGSLRARADERGLAAGYEGYNIMTRVLQGSSTGSASGTTRELRGGTVARIGPDLDLAAMAYAEGVSTLVQLFGGLHGAEARNLHTLSAGLLSGLPQVRDALGKAEEELWPTIPPPAPVTVAVVALYENGARRWYVYDPRRETVMVAYPPAEEPDLSGGLAALKGYDPSVWGGRPVTMTFQGLKVAPRAGAVAVAAAAVLVPRPA